LKRRRRRGEAEETWGEEEGGCQRIERREREGKGRQREGRRRSNAPDSD
jgi:hypothetical protein